MRISQISWVPVFASSRGLVNRTVNPSHRNRQNQRVRMKTRSLSLARSLRLLSSSVHHHLHSVSPLDPSILVMPTLPPPLTLPQLWILLGNEAAHSFLHLLRR